LGYSGSISFWLSSTDGGATWSRLPHQFAEKIVWGSRYPQQDTTSAWDAIQTLTQANIDEPTIARMLGGNAAEQFGIKLMQKVGG
jgi:predicted TIM-barrel fold metal-dependent hydrolase